ncbi:MAG TPA: tannase/feruloyl esterase family alpha/beta hydrolase [Verrucomicrobiae bacterium]|nr:tannase/feruloyl esterase family alpha/beta hydrolase [Verrucomicrobiae bacterium]
MSLQIPGSGMTITKAEPVPTVPPGTLRTASVGGDLIPVAIPSYCRADGTIDARTGVDGKPYAIGFEIALPDDWNGRFLFQGGGGLNGFVAPPLGTAAAGDTPALARGFAVVSTDTGHKGAVFDPAFMRDQLAYLDFAYVAVGRVSVLAKEIIARYYSQPPKRSYFAGCSTGGREAMLVSQRYPSYFDGVISGDPAMNTGNSNIGLSWAMSSFARIAPKDASGKPVPSQAFSSSDRKLLADAIMKACDEKDGLKDGLIFNRGACEFDPAVLQCRGAKTDACLSAGQVAALQRAFSGPKDSHGNQIYPRFPYDSDMVAEGPGLSFLPTAGPNILGNVLPSAARSVDEQAAAVRADAGQILTDTWSWTNLSSFSGHGGKLLFFHGTSDPWFSPYDTLGYYERLGKDNGGADRVMAWSRFFLVPGMSHCGGGAATLDNFDLLSAVVDWVENGVAPDFVVAKGKSLPGRTRPLCAYPKYAHYKGTGDPQDASSFECMQ